MSATALPDLMNLTIGTLTLGKILTSLLTLLVCLLLIRVLMKLVRKLLGKSHLDLRVQKYLLSGAKLLLYIVTALIVVDSLGIPITSLVALLICLAPTTIGALLSAIGIAGMSRLNQANVLAMSGRAIEAAGDVDVLLLDKTGTITLGNRQAAKFIPVDGVDVQELADAAVQALAGRKAALLANHGAVCWGKDLAEALLVAEILEKAAQIAVICKSSGGKVFELDAVDSEAMHTFYEEHYSKRQRGEE